MTAHPAKARITPPESAAPGATAGSPAPAAPGEAVPTPTPENTPVPGGGRWRWDIAGPGWVEVPEAD